MMTIFRNVSFALFVVTLVFAKQAAVEAGASCTTTTFASCPNNLDGYGKFCVWDRLPAPQTCTEFFNDFCSGYCNDDIQNGLDYVGTCPTDPFANAICRCRGWQACPPPEEPPQCGEWCNGDPECEECECGDGDWLYDSEGVPHCESPILISMRSNTAQYHLTSLHDGVLFDIDGNDIREQVSWTRVDSAVAFLAMDRNGNGSIDSGAELFGNNTRKRDGTRARHGFDALADLEDPSDADNVITPSDVAYPKLLLWTDTNHDGLSSASELQSLSQGGVVRLETTSVMRRRHDQHGNRYRFEGSVEIVENGRLQTRRTFDVFFVVAR